MCPSHKQSTIPEFRCTCENVAISTRCNADGINLRKSSTCTKVYSETREKRKNLLADVAKTIAAGGKVLIPAVLLYRTFSGGHSDFESVQWRRGQIPEFPVYVDGMVRKVNARYIHSFC